MSNVLIAYTTGDGQTRKVVQRIAETLARAGHAPKLADVQRELAPPIAGFAAVLIAAPVRFGKHHRAVLEFCAAHREELSARPAAFVSVSLSANRPTPGARREVAKSVAHLLRATAWVPPRIFSVAGALLYTRYRPFLRQVMRLFARMAGRETDASRDYEYTDWAAVDAFARELAAGLQAARTPAAAA